MSSGQHMSMRACPCIDLNSWTFLGSEQVDLYTPIMAHCGPVPFLDKPTAGRTACSLCAPQCEALSVHYRSPGYQFIAQAIAQAIGYPPPYSPPPPPSPQCPRPALPTSGACTYAANSTFAGTASKQVRNTQPPLFTPSLPPVFA
jgi:hypothetical protein